MERRCDVGACMVGFFSAEKLILDFLPVPAVAISLPAAGAGRKSDFLFVRLELFFLFCAAGAEQPVIKGRRLGLLAE